MIIDTHAHYDDEQFDADREELLGSMEEGGIGLIVNVGSTVASWDKIVELTEKYPFVYGAVGVHPDEVGELDEEKFLRMAELLDRDKIVAVGEIGLDYYWDKEKHDLQKEWFVCQLGLAREKEMPVIIHSREAAADTFEIMKQHAAGMKAVIHCYSYSPEMAREYVKMGYYIGVGGVVTFKTETSRAGDPAGVHRAGDRLSVSGSCPIQREKKLFIVPALCGRANCRAERNNSRRSHTTDRKKQQGAVWFVEYSENAAKRGQTPPKRGLTPFAEAV